MAMGTVWVCNAAIASGMLLSGSPPRETVAGLWMPPNEERAGDILLVDSTNFTTLFGGTDSLENFWRNLALMHNP